MASFVLIVLVAKLTPFDTHDTIFMCSFINFTQQHVSAEVIPPARRSASSPAAIEETNINTPPAPPPIGGRTGEEVKSRGMDRLLQEGTSAVSKNMLTILL